MVYEKGMAWYHESCRELKRHHFDSMKNHKSADLKLQAEGVLRILEIGSGPGFNFEFYPQNSQLTVVFIHEFIMVHDFIYIPF